MALTNAQKQARYRERRIGNTHNYTRLVAAVIGAFDAGRNSKFVRGLPEEPNAQCEELVRRLGDRALVTFPRREG